MSIITFWSSGREQTGKTLSTVAVSSYMAIEHNYKILVIPTGYQDKTMDNCFWKEKKEKKKNLGLFGPNNNVTIAEGISGLARSVENNKLKPESITNYTKIILKDRLEILPVFKGSLSEYENVKHSFPEIISLANKYYDLVFVDLDMQLGEELIEEIENISNLIVANISQRLSSIDNFMQIKEEKPILKSRKTIVLINKYDRFSKYTIKNITRYMGEKNKVLTIPYNTLFFEVCEEGKAMDLFFTLLKNKYIMDDDRNGYFFSEIKRVSESIIYRLQDLQIRM